MNAPADSSRERGFALVMALVATLVLSVMALAVMAIGRTDARLDRNAAEIARLTGVADAAINLTLLRMLDPAGAGPPPADGASFAVEFDGEDVQVSIQPEAGKIDLNYASGETLRAMFAAQGLDADAAQGLADKMSDWREAGAGKRLDGASVDDYRAAGRAYGPRKGPFESVGEARLVLGVSQPVYGRIAPLVTVFAQQPFVDPTLASAAVLRALPDMDGARVADALQGRTEVNGAARPAGFVGRSFTISAEVAGSRQVRVRRTAAARLTGFAVQPFWIYDWT